MEEVEVFVVGKATWFKKRKVGYLQKHHSFCESIVKNKEKLISQIN